MEDTAIRILLFINPLTKAWVVFRPTIRGKSRETVSKGALIMNVFCEKQIAQLQEEKKANEKKEKGTDGA